ncbi:LOC111597534 [Sergentomyia squamirostris]
MGENKESETYYKDELTPPTFLNQDFFENILRNEEKSFDLKITKLEITPGSKAKDHFSSIIFKAIVDYASQGKVTNGRRFVVKTLPVADTVKKELLKGSSIFDREIEMYTKVLPEMKSILESIGDDEEFAPSLIYCNRDPPILAFEDITSRGYVMHEPLFDFDNTIKITKKLAKFHALSYYMNDDNKYNQKLNLTQYQCLMDQAMMEKFKIFFHGFQYLKEEMTKWEGFAEIAEKIGNLNETFPDKLVQAFKFIPDFSVLCHGDFHAKNLMFIKNGENVEKTIFLDYQMCFWGSPVIDLIYVLYAIGDEVSRKRRKEIVLIYQRSLSEYLSRLGCSKKPPTLMDLNIDMLQKGTIEILWLVCFLPFSAIDFTTLDMESLTNPTPETMAKLRRTMYSNSNVVKMLKENLPELVFKGILH